MFQRRCSLNTSVWVVLALLLAGANVALAQLTAEDIEALRNQGEREGWTFTVDLNGACKYPLEKLCTFFQPEGWEKLAPWDRGDNTRDLPSSFDWRDLDGCTPVRSQGSCGSCWAFATVGPLECNIKIKDGISVNLSEQWLVSCNRDGWGCNGGFFAHMYHEWKTDPCGDTGAVMEADFPYVAWDAPCNCPYPHEYLIDGWSYISGTTAMKQAIMDHGPISVSVYANYAMQAYSGGIFNGCQNSTPNHAVVLVGWDDNQGTSGVWFLRNSWGTGWGEDGGYMRIPYGCSNVGQSSCYIVYGGAIPEFQWQYPNGIPDMVDPGVETTFRVDVYPDTGIPVPGTGCIHISTNGGVFIPYAMEESFPNQYTATLPAGDCYTHYDFYFSAQETGGQTVYDPRGAPGETYSAIVATGVTTIFDDDFESDQGWSVYAGADTGNWERANPQQVTSGGTVTQPEDDHSPNGTLCYVTGAAAGSGAGSYDVDGGPTRLTSPVLDLEDGDAVVSYWRWYHISTQWNDELVVEVSNNNGSSWTTVETIDDRETWTYVEWNVSDYVTPTAQVRVRFTADDSPNNSLVEALVDDFKVETIECEVVEYTLTVNIDGYGIVLKDPDQPTYSEGQVVTLSAFGGSGWSFDHWSGDLSGSDNPKQITMDSDKTVTAHFTEDQYTLTINIDGSGSVTKDPDQSTYTYGQTVTLTADADAGWTFDHWSGDLSGSDNPEQITMDGDKSVTAHFASEGPPPDCPEDLHTDGVIDLQDLGAFLAAYGSTPGDPNWNPYADFDDSNLIDLSDLGVILAVYGQDCPTR
jgi:C1A family cysteine protease